MQFCVFLAVAQGIIAGTVNRRYSSRIQTILQRNFGWIDKNEDGQISKEELKNDFTNSNDVLLQCKFTGFKGWTTYGCNIFMIRTKYACNINDDCDIICLRSSSKKGINMLAISSNRDQICLKCRKSF